MHNIGKVCMIMSKIDFRGGIASNFLLKNNNFPFLSLFLKLGQIICPSCFVKIVSLRVDDDHSGEVLNL